MEICIGQNQYFPSFDGGNTPAPIAHLDTVLRHSFAGCAAGIFATDIGDHGGAKQYYAAADVALDVQTIVAAVDYCGAAAAAKVDMHLYELMPAERPVRPYFDLEYDAAAIDDEAGMLDLFCQIIVACLEKAGFTRVRSFSVFTASGACERYASGRKGSYHLLCDTGGEAFRSVADHCRFLQTVVMPFLHAHPALRDRLSWKTPTHTALVLDGGVYKTNQTFRLPYQSKRASRRPLVPVHRWIVDGVSSDDWVYTCGVYEDPATLTLHDVVETIHRPPIARVSTDNGAEFDKAAALCACLTSAFLEKYTETMSLVWLLWGLERTDRMRGLIHSVCQRGRNYEAAWVDRLLRDARAHRSFTIGSLVVWARACVGKERVDEILRGFEPVAAAAAGTAVQHRDELFSLARVGDIPRQEMRHERYLGSIGMVDDGTTTLLMKSALGTGKSVAIRHMIRTERCARILVLSPRKSYTQSQLHSLTAADLYPFHSYLEHVGPLSHLPYLIVQVESLWRIAEDFIPYDLVIMDESESILSQLHSIVTNGAHLIDNHAVLERVVRTADRVVMTDAFLTDRTAQFARALRPLATMKYLENTYQPYERTATLLVAGNHEQACAAFEARIVEALDAGRRVVVVWTSKAAGEAFEAAHLQGRAYRFYHSESGLDAQDELQDVSQSWRDVQCLMMTTSITVGLSYDAVGDGEMYDELFLYGSSLTALPRDVAQTLLRVRRVRAERLTYTIHAIGGAGTGGLDAVVARLAAKEERVVREHPTANWITAPPWVKANHAWNENECVVSRGEYRAVLERYLVGSGYRLEVERVDVVEPDVQDDGSPPAAAKENAKTWSDIPLLREGAVSRLQAASLDAEQRLMLDKYQFRAQFSAECPDAVLCKAWATYYEAGRMNAFWNVVMERRWTLAQMARREARKRYAVMSTERIRKRGVMADILGCLGMDYTLQSTVLAHDALVALGPPLAEREARWRAELGLPKSRRKAAEWKIEHTIQWIRVAIETWAGGEVETVRTRERVEKKIVPRFQLKLNEHGTIWDHLKSTPFNDDEFRFIL